MNTYHDLVSWENRALDAAAKGDREAALQAHGQAVEIARGLNRPRLLAALDNRLGNALEAAGRIQDAPIAYEAGLKALAGEKQSDLDDVIDSMQGASKGYDPRYAFLEVPDLYSEAVASDLAEAEADPALTVRLLINAGNAYLRQPQMGPAQNAYEQALARPEIAGFPALRAHALTHLAIIHRRDGHIDEAEAQLKEALELLGQGGDHAEKRRVLAVLAGIQHERGQIDQALSTYEEALTLYEQSDDPLGEGRVRANLGHLYLGQGRYDEAAAAFHVAVQLAERVGDSDTLWHAYWGLGRCAHLAGRLDEATAAFRRSLDGIKARCHDLRTDEGQVTFLESVGDIFDHLIAVHLDRARVDASAYRDALQVAEEARGQALFQLMGTRRRQLHSRQTDVRETRLRPFEERVSPQIQSAPGIRVGPPAFNMAAQMAPGVPNAPGVPIEPPMFNMAAQMALAVENAPGVDLGDLSAGPVWDEDANDLHRLREMAGAIPNTVPRWPHEAESSRAPAGPPAPLPPLAHLVYHVLADRTAVFAVQPDGTVFGHVAAVGQTALEAQVAALRAALGVDDRPRGVEVRGLRPRPVAPPAADPDPLLRSLYAELVAPVAHTLPTGGTPVVIEPHGPLWLLPFAALCAPDDAWLADCWPLLYSPSREVLDEIRAEPDYGGPKQLSPLIVGNPTLPKTVKQGAQEFAFDPLPGSEQECSAISALFTENAATVLLGPAANWAQVVGRMPQHGIIHLATHGIALSEAPLDSFVALGVPDQQALDRLLGIQPNGTQEYRTSTSYLNVGLDSGKEGMLSARQILYLPLPADLVTLSACQTGLGQIAGDGMIGLSRSFLVAGARAVLVSLWSVSDAGTAELMAEFYRGYRELDDKAIALQRAMAALRGKPEYAHPRYWAPFVVVGAEA